MSLKLLIGLWTLRSLAIISATKLSSYEHGAEFDKCIQIRDWTKKTIYDDITLVDRESGGCCPKGTYPGAPYRGDNLMGPAVICGFKGEDSIEYKTGPGKDGNGVDLWASPGTMNNCSFNRCFVNKRNIQCEIGALSFMSGCCEEPACYRNHCGFKQGCSVTVTSPIGAYRESGIYNCHPRKQTHMTGTPDRSDDWKDGKLVFDKFRKWESCETLTCTDVWRKWQDEACDGVDAKEVCGEHRCGTYLRAADGMCTDELAVVNDTSSFIRDMATSLLKRCEGPKCVMIPLGLSKRIRALPCNGAE
jgi:hypothetical protein